MVSRLVEAESGRNSKEEEMNIRPPKNKETLFSLVESILQACGAFCRSIQFRMLPFLFLPSMI